MEITLNSTKFEGSHPFCQQLLCASALEGADRVRTVDNHLATLRAKLEQYAARPKHLRTVHGVGYKLVLQPYNYWEPLSREV